MKIGQVRLLCGFLMCGLAAAPNLCAQEPKGVGGDIKPEKVQQVKNAKPEKPHRFGRFPNLLSWWYGGGPGPVGAG